MENNTEVTQTENAKDFKLDLDHFDPELQEDKLWKARTGLDEESLCAAIETVIFMSDKPVSILKIRKLIDEDMPLKVIHESLARLQEEYESKHHGLRLSEVAEGYQFRTKATYSRYVQDLFKVNSLVLTPSALEVLAIIAYKQPVSRIEIDKIRGVESSHIVRGLMDKRLVKMMGRSDELGRPTVYGTTPEFLEVFDLADLSELPPESELQAMSVKGVGEIEDIKQIVEKNDSVNFDFDEIEELDKLSEDIGLISSETEFTKSLKLEDKKRFSKEGESKKSAFEILEDYINREAIAKQNDSSKGSDMITTALEPKVVNDLLENNLNAPEEIDEDMFVDLSSEEDAPLDGEMTGEEKTNFLYDDEREAIDLSKALDNAFQGLTGESLDELSEEESEAKLNVVEKEDNLEEVTQKILQDAKDLDIDLDFLTNNEKNTESNEDLH